MATRRLNVLVYAGEGSSDKAVKHCLYSLRRLLSGNYAVMEVGGDDIIRNPWSASCALLVFPGGADLDYCRKLNGAGNRSISQYVERGGSYLGLCAGAYYGSNRCEFEKGKELAVVGDRELAFYPGTCRGLAFPGFKYNSEAGARAVELKVLRERLGKDLVPSSFRSYYNGGGVFVDAPKYEGQGVEILANFTQELNVDAGEGSAAAVFCTVEQGAAVLSCTHPEFAAVNLDHKSTNPGYSDLVQALEEDDKKRSDFLAACLLKLGLDVNRESKEVPSLSRLHLSSAVPSNVSIFMDSLREVITVRGGEEYLKDDNDIFHFEKPTKWAFKSVVDTLPVLTDETTDDLASADDRDIDFDDVVKHVIVHDQTPPTATETPLFNHKTYYSKLKHYRSQKVSGEAEFGQYVLYGDVVTSTNTILEKNQQLLHRLPTGFTATANIQVAGRGRGSNVWVSPTGSLMFSTVIRHPSHMLAHAPVVFLQYIAAIAIVEGIKSYDKGFSNLPIKLKWPNDIYAIDPTSKALVKIGGILMNSHYTSEEFMNVIGVGLNTTNKAPTTSLNALNPPYPFTLEELLARILSTFSVLYSQFMHTGFDKSLEDLYYKHWLHSKQIVTLEAEGGVRACIKGISKDWGLLMAEELGWEDKPTGKVWALQSDSNSFDFFKGLVKRKVL